MDIRIIREKIKLWLYERNGVFKLDIYKNKWFWLVLVLKVAVGSFLASNFLVKLFIPFSNYFVANGWQNPYQYFFSQNLLNIFPYPSLMLDFLAIPRLIFSPFLSANIWQVGVMGQDI